MNDCAGLFLLRVVCWIYRGYTKTSPSTTNETRIFNAAKQTNAAAASWSAVDPWWFVLFRGPARYICMLSWLLENSWLCWLACVLMIWRKGKFMEGTVPLKFNMEPENEPLESEIPDLETIIFRWSMSNLSGGKRKSRKEDGLTRKMWRSRKWW